MKMGESKKQKQFITVPEKNKYYKGSGFGRWDAFVADFFAKHPDRKNDNMPPADNAKRRRKRKNDR